MRPSVGSRGLFARAPRVTPFVWTMSPKPKPQPKREVDMIEPFVRGRAAVKNFFDELEAATDTPVVELKRVFDGLQKLAVRNLKDKGVYSIPAMGTLRRIAKPNTTEAPFVIMDRTVTRREKPAKYKVICKVAPALNDKVVG